MYVVCVCVCACFVEICVLSLFFWFCSYVFLCLVVRIVLRHGLRDRHIDRIRGRAGSFLFFFSLSQAFRYC